MQVELVILTKSSKHKGYCVAGVDVKNGQWIRLVSADESSHGALFQRDMKYADKTASQILDVVRVQVVDRYPSANQPENVLIAQNHCWEKTGSLTIDEVLKIHPPEKHSLIFGNLFPYVIEADIGAIGYSLALVHGKYLHITRKPNPYGVNEKTKVSFKCGPKWYNNISVTDSDYYDIPDGTKISNAILVISLPDTPYPRDEYYKFVAKIFEL